MDDESESAERREVSTRGLPGRSGQEFRPVEMETTHDLDLTGLSDREARDLRDRVLASEKTDEIVMDVLGLTGGVAARRVFIRVLWGRWGQFPQVIRPIIQRSGDEEESPPDVLKETISRRYHVERQAEQDS